MNRASKPSLIVRIPTPIWLLLLVVIALLIDWPLNLPPLLQSRPAGIALVLAGIAWSGWARLTFRISSAEIFPWSEKHSTLVARGPFRFSRNPMYLGLNVVAVGAALIAGTWLMWLVPIALFSLDNFVIIPFEERSMERTFGDQFRHYQARVRRWL
jgi:protein-S-isoprenylcysteine O-methyltransferase Ste14